MEAVTRQGRMTPGGLPRDLHIERASSTDLMMLAMGTGAVPEQLGAVLVLDAGRGVDLPTVAGLIGDRIRAVPRLRQRLVRVPPGCGRPIWVDDAEFDVGRHVRAVACAPPGDERALLDVAAAVITDPLPMSRPLWSAVLVPGLVADRVGLVVVVHHVLADGIGGLTVLGHLVDQATPPRVGTRFPRRAPSPGALAVDAVLGGVRALRQLPGTWRAGLAAVGAVGGLHPVRAARCSLLTPTGPRSRLAVVRADVGELRAAAHPRGATVNDAVLTAVTGALHALLHSRGESVDTFFVAVPVATRRSVTAAQLGNQVGPTLVALPGAGDLERRLEQTAATMRARKMSVTGPPAIALLGPVFRAAAAHGAYSWYMRRQRRLHTLVTHVRGPDRAQSFAGATIRDIIPVAVGGGDNVTVAFVVMSYAGTLAITVVADPDHVPDLPTLTNALQAQVCALAALGVPITRHGSTLDR